MSENSSNEEVEHVPAEAVSLALREDAMDDSGMPMVITAGAAVPIDEVEELIAAGTNAAAKSSDKGKFIDQLWEMCSNLVMDSLSTQENRVHKEVLWMMAATTMKSLIENLPMKEDWQQRLFKYLPNNTWSADFLDDVEVQSTKAPTSKWLASNKSVAARSSADQINCLFGKWVREVAGRSRAYILKNLNKRYKSPAELGSGTSMSDMYLAVAKDIYPGDCHRRAMLSVKR